MLFGIRSIATSSPLAIKAAKVFVDRAKEIHGNTYDYSHVDYAGANSKVEIICPTHGSFMQTPSMHLSGNGCAECYNARRRERGDAWAKEAGQEFEAKARAVHGNKYDYSKVKYVLSSKPVEIVCPLHGSFKQAPASHLQGSGCAECRNELHRKNMQVVSAKAAETFIQKALEIHGNTYDYSKSHYETSGKPIVITCRLHGDFKQSPSKHLAGQGCPKCKDDKNKLFHIARNEKARSDFILKAKEVHHDKYDYSKAEYVDAKSKMIIGCPVHGYFVQTADSHLAGKGCIKCRDDINKELQQERSKKAGLKFPSQASEVHDGKYDYSEVVYVNKEEPVTIICPAHGRFKQSPNKHLQGNGCPQCALELNLGEERVSKALEALGINYERQFMPHWGKRSGQTRYGIIYDFALHDLKILIERDGEQHYHPVRFGGMDKERAKSLFDKQVAADLNKTKLADQHKWTLCRIPYFCEDVEAEVKNIVEGNPSFPKIPEIE
jgi:2'-5' RNA ligase